MHLARRSPLIAIALALGLLSAAIIPTPALAARADAPAQRWIVAVGRAGGSAIGPRGVLGPLPRLRAVPGDPAARRAVSRIIRTRGIRPTAVYRHAFNGFAASLTPDQVRALQRDPSVAVLMPDRATRVEATPAAGVVRIHLNGPITPTGIRRIKADQGPLSHIDGHNDVLDVDVAIIDTGIDPSPELRIAGGFDCSSNDRDAWRDREGHGTHVAGTIGARDDGKGVVGVAPGARLWAIKIFDDHGSGFYSQELCGFDTVLGMRDPQNPSRPLVEVINLSIGQWLTGFDDRDCGRASGDLIHGSICALVADGVTVVAAAGNQAVSTVTRQPAGYDEVITVSALADFDGLPGGVGKQKDICPTYSPDNDDTFGNFSNFGPDVDIIAPGKCILSTLPRGWYGHSTGTSMATPHVTGAAALIAAAHPGATPGQIKAALLGAATKDWKWRTDPDSTPDRLLDVSRLGALPDLALVAGDPSDELARGGVTRIDVTIERRGGHTGLVDVRATDLPEGLTADVAPSPTRGGAVAVWVRAATDAPAGPQQLTIRATDGDLVRTTTATVQVRSGGPTIAFSAPDGGADGLRITDGDQVTVALTEDAPGAPPAERRVLRQAGAVVTPGTCDGVDWAAVGDAVTPGELDPGGSAGTGWSFTADLTEDGCSRWLVRLIDADGDAARFASPAVLRDTTDPLLPRVRARGDGVWQPGSGTEVWVRGGTGSLTLTAEGRDAGSGVESHSFGPLSEPTGWTYTPTPVAATSQVAIAWGPGAVPADLRIRATDATGRQGPFRTVALRVDGSAPQAHGWLSPATGTSAVSGAVPELGWRSISDTGSGTALLQRVQRQVARPVADSCRGVSWVDDGPARMVAPHDEQWDVRSGWCHRWVLFPVDNVGNVGRKAVSGVLYIDVTGPAGDFRTPDERTETVITASRFSVAWKERRQAGGGTTSRTLERERVRAVNGACPTLGWLPNGRNDGGASPSLQTGLKVGFCYRWRLNLVDSRDNPSVELSGTVRVVAAP